MASTREKNRIEERRFEEVFQVDRLVVSRMELIQFALRELDVLIRLVGIAFDDPVLRKPKIVNLSKMWSDQRERTNRNRAVARIWLAALPPCDTTLCLGHHFR